jgi:hypothetical protein
MIDEFQEFFVEDDKIAQTASLLLDRIVRQGRAFGIHVLLGSQTLGGAYTVARTTLGQMVIRIALQCNEADAYLIMDENNPAPRLLSRPGEGIYNDAAGALEGNSPFQVVWLSDHERDEYLKRIREYADSSGRHYPPPIVFEGNAPADITENKLLSDLLHSEIVSRTITPRIWLGAPNSIKGPTEVTFHRQSGNNLLMVGQSEEAILAMIGAGMIALAAQHPLERRVLSSVTERLRERHIERSWKASSGHYLILSRSRNKMICRQLLPASQVKWLCGPNQPIPTTPQPASWSSTDSRNSAACGMKKISAFPQQIPTQSPTRRPC